MIGINCQLYIVYVLVRTEWTIMFKNRIDSDLVRVGYTLIQTRGFCSHLSCCLDSNLVKSC